MKYIYILNKFQAKNKSQKLARKLREVSDRFGRDYEIIINETPEDARKLRETFKDTEYIVTAIGGDGSINHLLNDLAGTKNILSFIPYGTGNDFFRSFSQNLSSEIREVDMVRINDRYFINAACFGVDADIANDEHFIHNGIIPRPLRFHISVLYHFLTHTKGRQLKIKCDGKMREGEFTTVVVANSQFYGGGYRISPASKIDDGLIELYAVETLIGPSLARCIMSMKNAGHLRHPAVKKIRAREITISSPTPFKANIDGEPLYSDQFEISIIPKGIRMQYDPVFVRVLLQ